MFSRKAARKIGLTWNPIVDLERRQTTLCRKGWNHSLRVGRDREAAGAESKNIKEMLRCDS
jgi:hypothetical protein